MMPTPGPPSGRGANKRTRSWKPYFRRGGSNAPPRERPVMLPIPAGPLNSSEAMTSVLGYPATSDPPTSIFLGNARSPPGWQLYFPQEPYNSGSSTVLRIEALKSHFCRKAELYELARIKKQFWFPLNLQVLLDDHIFMTQWSNFQQDIVEKPDTTLACAGLAMHKVVSDAAATLQLSQPTNPYQFCDNTCLQTIRPRIIGHGPILNLQSLKVNNYERLVAIRGTVIRAGAAEILYTWMAFSCQKCGTEQAVRLREGVVAFPTSCKGGCRTRGNFTELLSSPYTRSESFQTIRIQESMLGESYESGRVPRSIEAELTEDLVDSVCPGENITMTGILKVRPQEEFQRKGQASMYKTYIRAVSIASNKNSMSSRKSEFTEKDMEAIRLIGRDPNPFQLLVHSLCPTIYGHEVVKAGLILGLLGGCSSQPGKRTETHVLVVGDPGVGKSQMLQACAKVSPRGIFVCGSSSSSAGLTVTVRQEKGGGSLEAGALVLADQGVVCIDEFDKMSANHQSLLEVMEQQTVSVAKAGVLCSLPARTCVLAAANPSGGHYNRAKTVAENLKINPALLSRFDLVFILLDKPDAHLDSLLTAHIQALNSGERKLSSSSNSFVSAAQVRAGTSGKDSSETSILERMRLQPNEQVEHVPQALFQKYIAYARKNINPQLTPEAGQELKKFYLELRRVRAGVDTIPVTTRQLEALIRLTQARARLELSANATVEHAMDVLAIVRYSLVDVFSTDEGTLQVQRNINGCGMSQITQKKKFLRLLKIRSNALNKTVFELRELKEIAAQGGLIENLTNIVDSLNIQGFLLKKGQNIYKFISD